MHASPYRTNSNFQLRYFIVGYCYTADGAFGVLHSLQLAHKQRVAMQEVEAWNDEIIMLEREAAFELTTKALEKWERQLLTFAEHEVDEGATLERAKNERRKARVDYLRVRAEARTYDIMSEGRDIQNQAVREELAAIEELLAEIEPHRRFAHLPTLAAIEASQHDEWLGEFVGRGVNYALGGILGVPSDHVQAMRAHPAWGEPGGIVEQLSRVRNSFNSSPNLEVAMKALARPNFVHVAEEPAHGSLPEQVSGLRAEPARLPADHGADSGDAPDATRGRYLRAS